MVQTLSMQRCCQSVKDKNFESNSQLIVLLNKRNAAVVSLSKIKISKAIHNNVQTSPSITGAVVSLSKIKISKAIHNHGYQNSKMHCAVVSLSKIKISKAIHNVQASTCSFLCAVVSLSKIKISKAIHNTFEVCTCEVWLLSVCQR